MAPKQKRQPPLVFMYPVINSVNITKLITEVNQFHIIILIIINIPTQKVSVTYHFFRVIHLPCFLGPVNGVSTHQGEMNSIFVIKQRSNNTGQVGDSIKHRSLHCSPVTTTKSKDEQNDLVMINMCIIDYIVVLNIPDLLISL